MIKTETFNAKGELVTRTLSDEHQNSIKLTVNAKGQVSGEIKVYEDDPAVMDTKLNCYVELYNAHKTGLEGDEE